MEVILSGAQCTGKTSVIKALPEEYKPFCIREIIRNMTEQEPSIKVNADGDGRSQERFMHEYLYLFSKYRDYISDRGLLDVVSYTLWLGRKGNLPMELFEKQYIILREWLRIHPDVVHVYFPIYFPVVDDGYRDTDEDHRHGIDGCIQELINKLITDDVWTGYIMPDGTVQERTEWLTELLNNLSKTEE